MYAIFKYKEEKDILKVIDWKILEFGMKENKDLYLCKRYYNTKTIIKSLRPKFLRFVNTDTDKIKKDELRKSLLTKVLIIKNWGLT